MGWDDELLPTLIGSRIRLRWMSEYDIPAIQEIFSDPEVTRYWGHALITSREAARGLWQSVCDGLNTGSLYSWGIERLETSGIIGTCSLAGHDVNNRRADIGFALGRPHWGQGFATEAVRLLLDYGFRQFHLHRIEADVDPRNERSIGLLERHGFQREGYLRERWIVDGQLQDTVLLGLLRREWEPDANRRSGEETDNTAGKPTATG